MDFPIIDMRRTGEQISTLRKENHYTVEGLAEWMGVSPQAICKWQRGDSIPSVDNLYALSMIFKTSIDEILRGSKEEDIEPLPFHLAV